MARSRVPTNDWVCVPLSLPVRAQVATLALSSESVSGAEGAFGEGETAAPPKAADLVAALLPGGGGTTAGGGKAGGGAGGATMPAVVPPNTPVLQLPEGAELAVFELNQVVHNEWVP